MRPPTRIKSRSDPKNEEVGLKPVIFATAGRFTKRNLDRYAQRDGNFVLVYSRSCGFETDCDQEFLEAGDDAGIKAIEL